MLIFLTFLESTRSLSSFFKQCLYLFLWGHQVYPDEVFKPAIQPASNGLICLKLVDQDLLEYVKEVGRKDV
jgi:hypothetical protein